MQSDCSLATSLQFHYLAQKLPIHIHLWFYGLVVEKYSFHHRIKIPASYPSPSYLLDVFSVEAKNYAFEILKRLLKSEIGEEVKIDFLGVKGIYKRVN